MVMKRISRSDLIAALVAHADEMAIHDFVPFVGEFFGDGPEWEGVVRKSIKQELGSKDLQLRLDEAKAKNLELTKTIEGMKNSSSDYLLMAQATGRSARNRIKEVELLKAEVKALKEEIASLKSRITLPEGVTVIPLA